MTPGWLALALTMMLLALGIGPLSRLGPLFLRPHEAAWWLPMPGDRGTLLVPVARVEYLTAATAGAVMGVLPALASAGGWGAAVAWSVLIAAGTCLVLSELITAQVQGRGGNASAPVPDPARGGSLLGGDYFPLPALDDREHGGGDPGRDAGRRWDSALEAGTTHLGARARRWASYRRRPILRCPRLIAVFGHQSRRAAAVAGAASAGSPSPLRLARIGRRLLGLSEC